MIADTEYMVVIHLRSEWGKEKDLERGYSEVQMTDTEITDVHVEVVEYEQKI